MGKTVATNRKAFRDYEILERTECGIELKGSEVKSIRDGTINLEDGFARVEENGIFLYNTHINPYFQASYLNVESARPRRLLLHKGQIAKLSGKLAQRGLTLVPLSVYFNERGFAKLELALCKGKKTYDKRETVKQRETEMAIKRYMKNRRN